MADLITLAAFQTRLGRTVTDTALVEALIDDASALIIEIVDDSTVTDLWDAASPGTVPDAIVPVITSMIRRGLERPHDSTGESIGDYSYNGASGVGVFASRREAKIIRKAAGKSPAGALSLDGYLPSSPHETVVGTSWLDGAL